MDEAAASTSTTPDTGVVSPQVTEQASTAGADSSPASESSQYREALDRLAKGESAGDIQKSLHGGQQGAKAGSSGTPASKAEPQPDSAGQQDADGYGLDEKELNALRRVKLDLSTLKRLSVADRKVVARSMMAATAEHDRRFQQDLAAKKAAEAQGQEAPKEPESTNSGDPTKESIGSAEVSGGKPGQSNADDHSDLDPVKALPAAIRDPLQNLGMSDAEYRTLVDSYGEDFAKHMQQRDQKMLDTVRQAIAPQINLSLAIANQWQEREFKDAVAELKKTPGFDSLSDADMQKIRDKADLLIRAAGDLNQYRYADGVRDAAASLFRSNFEQAAQANLANSRKSSLSGSPDRGQTRMDDAKRPMTESQRAQAILEKMMYEGLSGDDARKAVDAA